jgi:hypothetical protein
MYRKYMGASTLLLHRWIHLLLRYESKGIKLHVINRTRTGKGGMKFFFFASLHNSSIKIDGYKSSVNFWLNVSSLY